MQHGRDPRGFCFLPEHNDFICFQIATFRAPTPKHLIDRCLERFPDYPPGKSDAQRQHWWADRLYRCFPRDWWGNPTDKCRHRDQILAMRDEWKRNIKDQFELANAAGRLRILTEALECAKAHGDAREIARVVREAREESPDVAPGFGHDVVFEDAQTDTCDPPVPASAGGA